MQASLVCVLISTNLVWFSRSARAPDRYSESNLTDTAWAPGEWGSGSRGKVESR
ncbi:hypothetical protein QR685DRAFT_535023 [Neurospora intermedia]|uniref:Uncharacterized protein n=1 Tax=Neurospora intermedia TaxID=5142 RepID=A0ABR3D2T7_NEUIN